jgi:hypothetical protein
MRSVVAIILLAGTVSVLSSSTWATQQDLAANDWSVNSQQSLAQRRPSDQAVLALVEKATGEKHQHLCTPFEFANLRNSGNLSLIVSTQSGTVCGVQIIDKTSSGFELYYVDSLYVEAKDLGGTGTSELIATTDLTYYEGANHCQAEWPVIYAWTGAGYSNVSDDYKQYYHQQLGSLKKQIAVLQLATHQPQAPALAETPVGRGTTVVAETEGGAPEASVHVEMSSPWPQAADEMPAAAPGPDAEGGDCVRAEAAKIERFLGISRDAGLDDAIKWANSDDPWTRVFASEILADISTPDARLYLRRLSRDPNRMVAGEAKDDLESGQAEQPTIDRVQFGIPASN